MYKLILNIIILSALTKVSYGNQSIVDPDNYKVEVDSNEIWGVYDKIIWKDVEVGGIKVLVDTASNRSLYKSFCIYQPNYTYNDTSYADALKTIMENTPKEFFMDVWEYDDDEWTRLNDYRNNWVLTIPKSKIWGGGYTMTNMFGTDLAKGAPSTKTPIFNAFQIHTFISGQKKIVMFMGVEDKHDVSMKDEDYIKQIPIYEKLKSNAQPKDTIINNELFKYLEIYGPFNFIEYKIIGKTAGNNKWKYYYIVYFGAEEKKKLEGVLNNIIKNSVLIE